MSLPRRRLRWSSFALLAVTIALAVSVPARALATISTVAGTGVGGFSAADEGALATSAAINGPRGVAWMPDGGFVFADFMNERVRRVSPDGQITTLAGSGATCPSPTNPCGDGGPATQAQFHYVHGVAVLADGSVVIADTLDNRIRRVDVVMGVITTVAGTGAQGFSGDGGPATQATINSPRGVATRGNDIYIPDSGNGRVRMVHGSTGTIATVAGGGTQAAPLAGESTLGATSVALGVPFSVGPTSDGGFLLADPPNNEIDRVRANGTINRVAGTGLSGSVVSSGDEGQASAALVSQPHSVVEAPDGGFLIAEMPPTKNPEDFPDNRVRYVAPNGVISTFVNASGIAGSAGDGGAPGAARLNGPRGLSIRPDGKLLIAEFGPPDFAQSGGDRIRFTTFDPSTLPRPVADSATFTDSPKSLRVSRAGRFAYAFAATPGRAGRAGLTSTRSIKIGSTKHKLKVASKSFTAPGNGTVRLKFKLSAQVLKAIKRRTSLSFTVRVKVGSKDFTTALKLKPSKNG